MGVEAADGGLKVAALVGFRQPGVPVHQVDLGVHTGGLQLLHQHLGGAHVGGVVGGDGDGEAQILIARLFQQGLGLLHVGLVVVGQLGHGVAAQGGEHAGAHGGAVAVHGQVDDGLLIHGVAQGLADTLIGKGGEIVVEIQRLDDVAAALHDGHIRHVGNLGGVQVAGQVDGAGAQAHHQGLGVGDDLQDHLIQIGALAPVFIKLLQHHAVLGGVGHEAEGAGAHGAVVGVDALGDDGHAHIGVELGVGGFQGDDDGAVVGGLHGGNTLYLAH